MNEREGRGGGIHHHPPLLPPLFQDEVADSVPLARQLPVIPHRRVLRIQGSGFRVQGSGFRVQGSGFRDQGSEFRVQGSGPGFRIQGSGFRVACECGCTSSAADAPSEVEASAPLLSASA